MRGPLLHGLAVQLVRGSGAGPRPAGERHAQGAAAACAAGHQHRQPARVAAAAVHQHPLTGTARLPAAAWGTGAGALMGRAWHGRHTASGKSYFSITLLLDAASSQVVPKHPGLSLVLQTKFNWKNPHSCFLLK